MLRALRLNPQTHAQWAAGLKAKIQQAADQGDYETAVSRLLNFKNEVWRNKLSGDAAVDSAYNQAETYVLVKLGEL